SGGKLLLAAGRLGALGAAGGVLRRATGRLVVVLRARSAVRDGLLAGVERRTLADGLEAAGLGDAGLLVVRWRATFRRAPRLPDLAAILFPPVIRPSGAGFLLCAEPLAEIGFHE